MFKFNILGRVKKKILRKIENVLNTCLSDKNLIKTIYVHVLPVAGYVLNVCRISYTDLQELDMTVKRKLREKRCHRRLRCDQRLYIYTKVGGKDLKKLRKMYRETKTIVACYLALSENIWTREVCKYVRSKEHCSVKKEVEKAWQDIGKQLVFSYIELKLNGE